jgi:hypothetical protein
MLWKRTVGWGWWSARPRGRYVSPTRRPLPLSCPRSVHRRCAPLSITVESSSRRPLPSPLRLRCASPSITVKELSCRPLPSSCRHAVHRRRAMSSIATVAIAVTAAPSIAVAPSVAVMPSIAIAPSIAVAAVDVASRSPLLLPLRCPTCPVAVASSIAVAVAPPLRAFSALVTS